jgi:hypothetical protein
MKPIDTHNRSADRGLSKAKYYKLGSNLTTPGYELEALLEAFGTLAVYQAIAKIERNKRENKEANRKGYHHMGNRFAAVE